ncbi:GRIP [Symbiodinium pilosum]|uniref:GRIP protein n=1 Tax=Symbiodinium pilosum TaxID=2952 RepID=A0A812X1F9_SYMPI|nr:GRIP [Symbiodinium pilosum]
MAGDKAASGLDLDLQAVENVPRDTLVALLRRKDKEVKTHQGKLEKLEERYVKVVRFNKILMEDRQSFQRFCHELLPECDGAFEEAAAQEAPTDLNELLRQLAVWRRSAESASEDRKVFQQFLQLVFPSDETVAELLKRPSLGEEAFDRLQQRWMQLEDLHNQSLASLNEMARQQVQEKASEIQVHQKALREAEAKMQDLKAELTSMAREKAQVLKQKLHGKGNQNDSGFLMVEESGEAASDELQAVMEQKAAAERREKEAWQALDRQRQAMQVSMDDLRAEARRLRMDLEREREEAQMARAQAQKLLDEKEAALGHMKQKTNELEEELSSNDFIGRLAEQQAGREVEMKNQQRQVQQLNQSLAEVQKMLQMSYAQEKVLKDRIRELESSQGRSNVAGDYLKHVVLKYIEYCQKGDLKSQSLVPVLCTLLNLSPAERRLVEHSSIPAPLLHINQAAGAAGAWLWSGEKMPETTSESPS